MKNTAIILAAGSGRRMRANVKKQYLELDGKPVLFYSLKAFDDSFIDEIILVSAGEDLEYCQNEIVGKYAFKKVSAIVEGGRERYHSVMNGLNAIDSCDYVYIHDGARPFIDRDILEGARECAGIHGCAIVSMPVKDTIRITDESGHVISTPKRNNVLKMQTPQVFEFEKIKAAYTELIKNEDRLLRDGVMITDDAMVMETFGDIDISFSKGSYSNIKITTPEDLLIGEALIKQGNI